jgi:hypothetical protein
MDSVHVVAPRDEVEIIAAALLSWGRLAERKRAEARGKRGRLGQRGEVGAPAVLNDLARENGRLALLLL